VVKMIFSLILFYFYELLRIPDPKSHCLIRGVSCVYVSVAASLLNLIWL